MHEEFAAPSIIPYQNGLKSINSFFACRALSYIKRMKGTAMSSQPISTRMKRFVHRNGPLQVGLVLAFWFAGQSIVRLTGLPVPGGVVGMLAVLLLFATRWLSVLSMRRGAEWLIGDMVLFSYPRSWRCSITASC